jgi:F-type H+-transporting ATPase subunit c
MIIDLITTAQEIAAHAAPVAAGFEGRFFTAGFAGIGAALAVGMIGSKAAEAVGRNPRRLPEHPYH